METARGDCCFQRTHINGEVRRVFHSSEHSSAIYTIHKKNKKIGFMFFFVWSLGLKGIYSLLAWLLQVSWVLLDRCLSSFSS